MSTGIFIGVIGLVVLVVILLMIRDERKQIQEAMLRMDYAAAAIEEAEDNLVKIDRNEFKYIWLIMQKGLDSEGLLYTSKLGPDRQDEVVHEDLVRIYIGEL